MLGKHDVEAGRQQYDSTTEVDTEREALLSSPNNEEDEKSPLPAKSSYSCAHRKFAGVHVGVAFVAGIVACLIAQYAFCGLDCLKAHGDANGSMDVVDSTDIKEGLAPTYVGSTEVFQYPPPTPTNAFPSMFPTNVGYAGGTPTGTEAAVIATAPSYPIQSGAAQLVIPESFKKAKKFNLLEKWGNLSPWFSIERGRFGVDSGPEIPETCRLTGLHFLHRHGARYPTAWAAYGGPAQFSGRLRGSASKWNATGDLSFMNEWTFKLGAELLTPFGRQQLYDMGISMRIKYGFLLQNFTDTNTLPVFRTESQDRMLHSALNFALGFFGYPIEGQYQQSITIEADGFNNTLSPYKTCPNANNKSKSERGVWYVKKWTNIYLQDAVKRLNAQLDGFDLSTEDVYAMQQMCAYETVALGYSKFCELFTEKEWDGFDYALDLFFWYGSAFGSPVARVQGIGYIQELVARLTHTPIAVHNSSTNATLDDNPITFPLNQSLYVDATHEVVVLNILTALNLSNFAESGPLPYTHVPKHRSFRSAELSPFATNVQFQLLECTSVPDPQIRIIVNDGVVPLQGIRGCPKQKDGMCPVDRFVEAQKQIIRETDWIYDCHGDWTVPEGTDWETVTGDPPQN